MRAERIARVLRKYDITKEDKKVALNQIRKCEKLFGNKGKNWIQGEPNDGFGGFCLFGGMDEVSNEMVSEFAELAISLAIPGNEEKPSGDLKDWLDDDMSIPEYNDAPSRNFSQIKSVIKRAKKALQSV